MARYVAFLRAINVGGHVVKMEALRDLFSALGFANVETFIASGNVIFETKAAGDNVLEKKIERRLEAALGYEVGTFVRSVEEIRAISEYQPFDKAALALSQALNIGFLQDRLSASTLAAVMAFASPIDDFHVHGREVYWLCRTKQSDSKFTGKTLERALKAPVTFRSASTINRLASKFSVARFES